MIFKVSEYWAMRADSFQISETNYLMVYHDLGTFLWAASFQGRIQCCDKHKKYCFLLDKNYSLRRSISASSMSISACIFMGELSVGVSVVLASGVDLSLTTRLI